MKFIDGHSKPLIGSREVNEANYLQKVGYVRDIEEEIELKGYCLRVSQPSLPPFQLGVIIAKPFPGYEVKAKCQCDGGATGKCKHAVAILRSVEM